MIGNALGIKLAGWCRVLAALLVCSCAALEAAGAGPTPGYPLPACAGAGDRQCIAQVLPDYGRAAPAGWAARADYLPACYLEPWDRDLWQVAGTYPAAHPCRRGEPPAAAVQDYFRCRDPLCGVRERPQLGLALEGGGSKSSPYAMGVMAGLAETGLLPEVGVISSVSGGSYSAYFYMSRWYDWVQSTAHAGGEAPLADWFRSCIPKAYDDLFTNLRSHEQAPLPKHCEAPFQQHVANHQDLLSQTSSAGRASGIVDAGSVLGNVVAPLTALQALTLVPLNPGWGLLGSVHHVAHTLFDWPVNLSPSREAYRQGIERAFGFDYQQWAAAAATEPGERIERRRRERSMSGFADAYARSCNSERGCRMPLWIANTTASTGRSMWGWVEDPQRDSFRYQFELGPLGHGSGMFGYARTPPPMAMIDAVGASAAFFDDEQRVFTGGSRLLVGTTAHVANLDWGTELENFNLPETARTLQWFKPWPFYTFTEGRHGAPFIHLSDGGNSDNIGMFALLRRGARNIIVSASTDDRDGRFPSLCRLKNQLDLDGIYTLEIPELQDFARVCNLEFDRNDAKTWGEERVRALRCSRVGGGGGDDSPGCASQPSCEAPASPNLAKVRGYDLFAWDRPYVRGCVLRRGTGTAAAGAADPCDASFEASADPATPRLIARLFVLKPAVDAARVSDHLDMQGLAWPPAAAGSGPGADPLACGCFGAAFAASRGQVERCLLPGGESAGKTGASLPCTALAFMRSNTCNGDGRPDFPQHDLILMTLNSSPTLYGAYFDLAREQARALRAELSPDAVRQGAAAGLPRNRLPADPCLIEGWTAAACQARLAADARRRDTCHPRPAFQPVGLKAEADRPAQPAVVDQR